MLICKKQTCMHHCIACTACTITEYRAVQVKLCNCNYYQIVQRFRALPVQVSVLFPFSFPYRSLIYFTVRAKVRLISGRPRHKVRLESFRAKTVNTTILVQKRLNYHNWTLYTPWVCGRKRTLACAFGNVCFWSSSTKDLISKNGSE